MQLLQVVLIVWIVYRIIRQFNIGMITRSKNGMVQSIMPCFCAIYTKPKCICFDTFCEDLPGTTIAAVLFFCANVTKLGISNKNKCATLYGVFDTCYLGNYRFNALKTSLRLFCMNLWKCMWIAYSLVSCLTIYRMYTIWYY